MKRYKFEYKDDSDKYKCPGCGSHLIVKLKTNLYTTDDQLHVSIHCTDDVYKDAPINTLKSCQLIDEKYKPLNLLKLYRDEKYFDLLQDAKWYFIEEIKKQSMELEELRFKIVELRLKEFL